MSVPDFDLDDDELRAAGTVKWSLPAPGVLAAWVAEMDVRPCPEIVTALHRAVDAGTLGYPPPDRVSGLGQALAAFWRQRFGVAIDPGRVIAAGDVMAGVRLVVETLCERAPVVVPVPSYPPFLHAVPLTGRPLIPVPAPPAGPALDVERIERALADGARTVLLSAPHNPLGRPLWREELESLREACLRHGARVLSDEIHAPLLLPGARHVPYATLEGTADHVTTFLAASKAWNLPGLKCAQIVPGNDADAARLRALPHVANAGTSVLGVVATIAAYRDGGAWLDGVLAHLTRMRDLLGELVAGRLPGVTWTPTTATYLAWLDASGTGWADPAARALAAGRVMVNPGRDFGPGYERCVRLNFATSAERLERVVDALARAWDGGAATTA